MPRPRPTGTPSSGRLGLCFCSGAIGRVGFRAGSASFSTLWQAGSSGRWFSSGVLGGTATGVTKCVEAAKRKPLVKLRRACHKVEKLAEVPSFPTFSARESFPDRGRRRPMCRGAFDRHRVGPFGSDFHPVSTTREHPPPRRLAGAFYQWQTTTSPDWMMLKRSAAEPTGRFTQPWLPRPCWYSVPPNAACQSASCRPMTLPTKGIQ